MANIPFVHVAYSRSDLLDLIQFVGIGAAPIMVTDVSLLIERNFEGRQ